jgi:hypothetical protein
MSTSDTSSTPIPTFALERFAWDAPDRLEVSGWFSGLRHAPANPPVLLLRGSERTHRLPAVPNGGSPSPHEDGQRWRATFTWLQAPEAFETAELELGAGIAVELPEPRPEREAFGDRVLAVRRSGDAAEHAWDRPAPSGGTERVRLEAELLVAAETARDLRSAVRRSADELTRARDDLEAERERRTADAERFREGIERVRGSAEEALAAEQGAAQRLELELRDAHAEIAALRERVAVLERTGEEAPRLATEARAEAERLLDRLIAIESSLDDGRAPA